MPSFPAFLQICEEYADALEGFRFDWRDLYSTQLFLCVRVA
jgi:hypothetical protein